MPPKPSTVPLRRLAPLLILAGLVACGGDDPTAPGPQVVGRVEGELVVTNGATWPDLVLSPLPTVVECGSGLPREGPVQVTASGGLLQGGDFSGQVSAVMEPGLACFELEVREGGAESGPRVLIGPVDFREGGGAPAVLTLEYDGERLTILD